jgi:hypothetical protein
MNPLFMLGGGLGAGAYITDQTIEPITERAKTRDFERNMGAARYRTQLGTQQGLTLQGQVGAQKLAQQGMQGATQALASNYQYQ